MARPTLPTVGGSNNGWGTLINSAINAISDALDAAVSTLGNTVRFDTSQGLNTTQQNQAKANIGVPNQLVPVVSRTFAQGVPTAAECAGLGYPDGTVITVDQS